MSPVTSWNPGAVYIPLRRANIVAIRETAALANSIAKAEAHIDADVHATQVGDVAVLKPSNPVANLFEGGTKAHEIAPHDKFLYLKGLDRFVSSAVQNPGMAARPFMHPAARAFPALFARAARVSFARHL